jgi:hypothetical protein
MCKDLDTHTRPDQFLGGKSEQCFVRLSDDD